MSASSNTGMPASSKWLPIALIFLGVLLVIAAFAFPLIAKPVSESASAPIPTQVVHLSLASEEMGSAALREFTELHGESFPVHSGAKAVYGPENQVIIWAVGTGSTADTRKLLEEMRDKIAEGNSPFQPNGEQKVANREVYTLNDMGQKHFYFQSGKYLIWLAANPEIADQALQEALFFYK